MEPKSLETELWREYDYGGRVYRIDSPKELYVGSTTHRVVAEDGTVSCVPSPGYFGCVLRWKHKDTTVPVAF